MNFNINASDLPGWLQCPAKQTFLTTEAYLIERREFPSVAAVFGSRVDDAVTYPDSPTQVIPPNTAYDRTTASKTDLERQVGTLADKLREHIKGWGGEIVMAQERVETTVGFGYMNITISGRVDLLLKKDDAYRLVDLKTGENLDKSKIGRNWPQLVCYLTGLQENHNICADTATILFGRRGILTMFDKQVSVDQIDMETDKLIPMFGSYMRRLGSALREPTPVPGAHCRGCPNQGCPFHPGL